MAVVAGVDVGKASPDLSMRVRWHVLTTWLKALEGY